MEMFSLLFMDKFGIAFEFWTLLHFVIWTFNLALSVPELSICASVPQP